MMMKSAVLALVLLVAPAAQGYSNVKVATEHRKVTSVVFGGTCLETPSASYGACVENWDNHAVDGEEKFLFEGKSCAELKYTSRVEDRVGAFPQAQIYLACDDCERPALVQALVSARTQCSKECADDVTRCGEKSIMSLIEKDVQMGEEQKQEGRANARRKEWYRRALRQWAGVQ